MADVGEETAFGFVEFLKLLIALFEHFAVGIQLKAQSKLAKAGAMLEVRADDDNDVHQTDEVEVIDYCFQRRIRAVQESSRNVNHQDQRHSEHALRQRPVQNRADGEQHEIQPCIVRRAEPLAHSDHYGDEDHRQERHDNAQQTTAAA